MEKIEKLNSIRVDSYEQLFKNFFFKYKEKLLDSCLFLGDISLKGDMPCNINMFLESAPIASFVFSLKDKYLDLGIFLAWSAKNKEDFKKAKEKHVDNFMDTFIDYHDDFNILSLSSKKKRKISSIYYPHCSIKINNVVRIINYGEKGFFIQSSRNSSLLCLITNNHQDKAYAKFGRYLDDESKYIIEMGGEAYSSAPLDVEKEAFNDMHDERFFIKDISNVDYMEEIWQIKELDIYNYSDLLDMKDNKTDKEVNYGQRNSIELLF